MANWGTAGTPPAHIVTRPAVTVTVPWTTGATPGLTEIEPALTGMHQDEYGVKPGRTVAPPESFASKTVATPG